MAHMVDLPLIRADLYTGDLAGKEITVNVPQYGESFGARYQGKPFFLHDVFTVIAETTHNGEKWIGFMNDDGQKDISRAERFYVLDV